MFWRKRSVESDEAKIIEQAKKSLRYVDRWGAWWAAFHWAAAIAYSVLLIAVCRLVAGFGNFLGANRAELWCGFALGMFGGTALYHMSSSVGVALRSRLPDVRDRLLVQYHDGLRQVLDKAAKTATGHEDQGVVHREEATDRGTELVAPVHQLSSPAGI